MSINKNIHVYNARVILVDKFPHITEILYEDDLRYNKIKQLVFGRGRKTMTIGKHFEIGLERYYIDVIEKTDSGYKVATSRLTRTSCYLLPSLGISIKELSWKHNGSFINAYLHRDIEDIMCLVFRVSGIANSNSLAIEKLKARTNCIDYYQPDNTHEVLLFRMDRKYYQDYNMFIKSKYSKISDKYKARIVDFHDAHKTSSIYGILYKTELARQQLEEKIGVPIPNDIEYGEVLDLEKEYIDNCNVIRYHNKVIL